METASRILHARKNGQGIILAKKFCADRHLRKQVVSTFDVESKSQKKLADAKPEPQTSRRSYLRRQNL